MISITKVVLAMLTITVFAIAFDTAMLDIAERTGQTADLTEIEQFKLTSSISNVSSSLNNRLSNTTAGDLTSLYGLSITLSAILFDVVNIVLFIPTYFLSMITTVLTALSVPSAIIHAVSVFIALLASLYAFVLLTNREGI